LNIFKQKYTTQHQTQSTTINTN